MSGGSIGDRTPLMRTEKKVALLPLIKSRKAKVAVLGLGYVGLITAVMTAKAGFAVRGVDVSSSVVANMLRGVPHFKETGLKQLLRRVLKSKKFEATTSSNDSIPEAHIVIISVQTPITADGEPDLTPLLSAVDEVKRLGHFGKLIIIESSVPPGTTRQIIDRISIHGPRSQCGRDYWLTHCPERLSPGLAIKEFSTNPRLIGGIDQESTTLALEFYRALTKGSLVVADASATEIAKLAENTARDVDIAFANELAIICENIGVDVCDVIRLINTHPRVRILSPGPGVGGPCLPKDPYLLIHQTEKQGFNLLIARTARYVNARMPYYVVEMTQRAFRKIGRPLTGSKIGVLGVAYKANVSDVRGSPALEIVEKLLNLGCVLRVYDPFVDERIGSAKVASVEEAAKDADCLMVLTDHNIFRNMKILRLAKLMKKPPVIVDARRIVDVEEAKRAGVHYVGLGRRI